MLVEDLLVVMTTAHVALHPSCTATHRPSFLCAQSGFPLGKRACKYSSGCMKHAGGCLQKDIFGEKAFKSLFKPTPSRILDICPTGVDF